MDPALSFLQGQLTDLLRLLLEQRAQLAELTAKVDRLLERQHPPLAGPKTPTPK